MKSLLASLIALLFSPAITAAEKAVFVNPIAEGADPWVTRYNNEKYLWCFSERNRGVSIWISDQLTSIGKRVVVWQAPDAGPWSKEVWAPEMHFLDGKWFVYFAASDGNNANHLAYVLESSGSEPFGPYEVHGPFATGDGVDGKSPNIWAIDMTVLEHGGKRYAIWSGWDEPGSDRQFLYIAPMKNPRELAGPRVLLCANDSYLWERTEENESSRGLNEGPEILKNAGRTFLTYSCGASWSHTYKLGILELKGKDPLDPKSWQKQPQPVFASAATVIGVGHGTFVPSPDGSETWHVYHAKVDDRTGWRRAIHVQPIAFKSDGFPDFGKPANPDIPMPVPGGQTARIVSLPLDLKLDKTNGGLTGFSYYGHQQFVAQENDGVDLGSVPKDPVNDYRSGEKLVMDGGDFSDVEATVTIRFIEGSRDAGLLIRTTLPSVGFDAQRGYFAGVVPGQKRVIFGKTDGKNWQEIARADVDLPADGKVILGVRVVGDQFKVSLNGKQALETKDATWTSGSIGLRVVDTHARFSDLKVSEIR